ncbi:MAG: hypothetical protein KIS78_32600 [Labilithrix sp.]|nr:hypothetical protein [Labilithrix sp.]MCW5837180.1 hypothetical protein [Labilithrix sp.]
MTGRSCGLRRVVVLALVGAGCSTASGTQPSRPVAAASPPKDDGKSAQGGAGGTSHSAALEQLKVAPVSSKADKQHAVRVPLPDAEHWTRVRFLTLKSLVGFRYGKDHHAIFAAFVTHVDDNSVQGACNKSFEQWATPWIEAFEVELKHDPPVAFAWSAPSPPPSPGAEPPVKKISIVDVDPVHAKTATVLARESYEAAWAAYPAWGDKACLVTGVAVPARDDPQRAREVRDRFLQEVFPKIEVTGHEEPKERY